MGRSRTALDGRYCPEQAGRLQRRPPPHTLHLRPRRQPRWHGQPHIRHGSPGGVRTGGASTQRLLQPGHPPDRTPLPRLPVLLALTQPPETQEPAFKRALVPSILQTAYAKHHARRCQIRRALTYSRCVKFRARRCQVSRALTRSAETRKPRNAGLSVFNMAVRESAVSSFFNVSPNPPGNPWSLDSTGLAA